MKRSEVREISVDPSSPRVSDDLAPPPEGRGEIAILLVDLAVRRAGWADPLVIDLAESWAAVDRSVILADGDFTLSTLHDLVGTLNLEGVSDLVCYGASMERVARPVGSRSFRFIPKGTLVADPESAYREPRWSAWFSRVREVGEVLIIVLPSEIDGVSDIAGEADRVLHLVEGDAHGVEHEGMTLVRATAPESPAEAVPEPMTSGVDMRAEAPALADSGSPGGSRKTKTPDRRVVPMILLGILIVLAALAVAAWLGLIPMPGPAGGLASG